MAQRKLTGQNKIDLAKFKERAEKLRGELQDLLTETAEYVQGIQDEAQEYFDERSEKWQESEKAAPFEEWIDALSCEAEDLDELDEFLDNLPEEPEN